MAEEQHVLASSNQVTSVLTEHNSSVFQFSPTQCNPKCFLEMYGARSSFEDDQASTYSSDSETSGATDRSSSVVSTPEYVKSTMESKLSNVVGQEVHTVPKSGSVARYMQSRIDDGLETASFLTTNLATVVAQYKQWKEELPMVTPFYAVKCNPDPVILRLLASLGCSFDCATMGEIDLVLNGLGDELSFARRGLAKTSIVYANPAKMEHMLQFAIENKVGMTVFDGEDELVKIAGMEGHENLKLLLRLTTDDRASICRFSKKFGCPVDDARHLMEVAKSLGLNVAGVSFHVGSGCGDAAAYTTALSHAKRVFDMAQDLNMPAMSIVDLGGGFPGDTGGYGGPGMPTFQQLAKAIRHGIQAFTNEVQTKVRFIAEPGRYFVSSSTVIATKIYSRKGGNNDYQALYVDDGVYGSFNNVVYDHACPVPRKLSLAVQDKLVDDSAAAVIPTAVFGPTCDGLDQMCSLESTLLSRCQVNDWLIFENNGAYTHTASFVFNGYTHVPKKSYCFCEAF